MRRETEGKPIEKGPTDLLRVRLDADLTPTSEVTATITEPVKGLSPSEHADMWRDTERKVYKVRSGSGESFASGSIVFIHKLSGFWCTIAPKPVLMVALGDFALQVTDSEGTTYSTDHDAPVALCVPLVRRPETSITETGIAGKMTYFPSGEAIPVYAPVWGRDGNDSNCRWTDIKCGTRLWAIANGESGRCEVVSLNSNSAGGSDCDCSWNGFALWRVVAGPAWELAENRCLGCGHGVADDLRFNETVDESELVEPVIAPPASWIGTDRLYVTCCGSEPDPEPPCPTCCYSISVPIPACGGGTDGSLELVLSGGGAGFPCGWSSGAFRNLIDDIFCSNWTPPHFSNRSWLVRAVMYSNTNFLFVHLRFAAETDVTYIAKYLVTGDIDCTVPLTAALVEVVQATPGTWECTECALDPMDVFPASRDVTLLGDCDDEPLPEPPDGRCCIDDECSVTEELDCLGDWTEGQDCDHEDPCDPLGRCCYGGEAGQPGHACVVNTEVECTELAAYAVWSEGLDCGPLNDCNAACVPSGCVYEFQEFDGWQVVANNCNEGCIDCDSPPGFPGEIGEKAFADCIEGA